MIKKKKKIATLKAMRKRYSQRQAEFQLDKKGEKIFREQSKIIGKNSLGKMTGL